MKAGSSRNRIGGPASKDRTD